ncbi:MAG: translocation/assembly module TamB domain-containing protein, partial [Alistipes sp.]|nr:translocation/assembly module TamB domain-containing protein [Alistipes sp.]
DIVASSEDNSRFYMPLSDKSNISSADFVTFVNPSSVDTTSYLVRKKLMFERRQRQRTAAGGGMDITMALDVRPNAEVQLVIDPTVGDIIKGRGDGLLNLRINPTADIFEMYGDYTIEEGSYLFTLQNIVNKKFVIERGSTIQWTGEPLDATLNIDAIYKLKASLQPLLDGYISQDSHSIPTRAVPVECVIHLTDRLTRPTVTFDVLVPSVDPNIQSIITNVLSTPERRSQQFLYLLVANSFISDNTATASTYGASTAAATGFELLSNQLSNWLATENSNIVLRYRPRTEQMMSDEVDFGFSQALLNNRVLIEVEGNYLVDRSQVVNAASSFTGEAYVTWLIDKAGTLRLKGFTHTIDRFDENQGLQETGIGIYYKEDFDNAADLRRRVASRFSRKRRLSARSEQGGDENTKSKNENLNK